MKQILQNARSGSLELIEVPAPMPAPGQILVQTRYSVMSPGTDKVAMSFARKSMLGKARSRPDLVRQVVTKLQQEGPSATYRTVTSRLDAPQPLGYSSAGIVRAVGPDVTEFAVGDRVACAGAGYANHAELVSVPCNLAVRVPDEVPLSAAAYSTLGAIAMQGLRVAEPTLGETAAVVGLGLVGQLTVQLLRANGCRVLGLDLDERRAAQAKSQGATWVAKPGELGDAWMRAHTDGAGVDLAFVTAASSSSAPLELAAELCRRKGRIAFVGAMPIELDRRVMYDKELDLRMSMSYGPGRYDRRYEEQGLDYPIAYVRWTENRNLRAFLELIESGAIDPLKLDTETRPFEDAVEAYEELEAGRASSLAVVFEYAERVEETRSVVLRDAPTPKTREETGVAFIGAGNYAKAVLLPLLKKMPRVDRLTLVTATGPSARQTARTQGFRGCSTEPEAVFKDPNVDFIFVTTRHDTHVDYAVQALENQKGVWLEKPAALDIPELERLLAMRDETDGFLSIGYNRRFSSHTRAIQDIFAKREGPMMMHYRVITPAPPPDSWLLDPKEGGGRIVGEACHFIDLCNAIVGAHVERVYARALVPGGLDDTVTSILEYADGSVATIDYLANAGSELPKEVFEVSADGCTAICDNYRRTRVTGGSDYRTFNQDKGQGHAIGEVLAAHREGRPSPFSGADIANVSLATFAIERSAAEGRAIEIDTEGVRLRAAGDAQEEADAS